MGSRRYQDFDSYLLTPDEWQHLQDNGQTRLMLSGDAQAYLEDRQQQIERMLHLLSEELPHHEHLSLDVQGQLHLARLEKMEDIDPEPWQRRLNRLIPTMQLADLIIEVDQWTNFLSHFTHLTFGEPTTGKQKATLVAALMGLGMNIGLERMSLATDYSVAEIAAAADWYIREETLQPALMELDNFVLKQPMARAWGDGSTSSSDGLRVLVQANTPQAVRNARYFGRQRGVTIITHVADIQMPFGRQCVISTDDREALYVIDNLCHHETDLNILEHYTDTAGYTYHVFAICAFLGIHFAPNIRSMTDQLLFTVNDLAVPSPFASVFRGTIESHLVIDHWHELRRLVASIRHGKVSASLIMRKLAAYPRQNQLAKALREMGKLERTLFVLEYLYDEAFRRRIRIGLNKGELLYKLARALFLGQSGEFHDRLFQDQLHRASCLMLLIAAIVAWNTRYFQHAAAWLEQQGTPIPSKVLPHLSPISWKHINFLGHYSFDLDKAPPLGTLRPLNVKPL